MTKLLNKLKYIFFSLFVVDLHVTRSSLVQFGHKHRLKTLEQQQLQLTSRQQKAQMCRQLQFSTFILAYVVSSRLQNARLC